MQKTIARILLPILTVWAVMLPTRVYGFGVLVLGAARLAAVALENPIGTQMVLGAATIAVGTAITAMHFNRNDGTNNRNDDFYMTASPRQPSATEAAQGFTAGSPSLNPAATDGVPFLMYHIYNIDHSVLSQACANWALTQGTSGGSGLIEARTGFPYGVCVAYGPTGVKIGEATITSSTSCHAGYVISAGTCVLGNASAVPRPVDNVCPVVKNANTYTADPYDPDCANGQNATFTNPAAGVSNWKFTDYRGWVQEFTVNADGSKMLTQWVPDTVTNTTKKTSVALTPGATPADPPLVSGISSETLAGTGSLMGAAGSAGATPTTSDPLLTAAVDANTGAINALKAEVAATGEANTVDTPAIAAAAAVVAKYQAEAGDVTNRANGFGLPSLPAFLFPSFTPAVCLPIGWTFQGHPVSFDLCPYVPTIKSISGWILNLIAAAAAFSMLMNFRAMRLHA